MIDKNTFKISILIPCYNEKNTINLVVENVRKSLKKNKFDNYELICWRLFKRWYSWNFKNIRKPTKCQNNLSNFNQGKGGAIQTAITSATGEVTLIQMLTWIWSKWLSKLLLPFLKQMQMLLWLKIYRRRKYVRIHFWHFFSK